MPSTEYCQVGFLTKPKGLKGALRVSFEDFFIPYLENQQPDHLFVEVKGQLAPFFIETIENLNSSKTSVKFEDINHIEAATKLQNSSLYFKEALLSEYLEEEEEEWAYLVGYTLLNDKNQAIGIIEGIVYLPQHELLQLQYQKRELLLPIHEDIIIAIDEEEKNLQMELPQGILDL